MNQFTLAAKICCKKQVIAWPANFHSLEASDRPTGSPKQETMCADDGGKLQGGGRDLARSDGRTESGKPIIQRDHAEAFRRQQDRCIVTSPIGGLPLKPLILDLPEFMNRIEQLRHTVTPFRRLLVGNFATEAANLGYCEAVMALWIIPRSVQEMAKLANAFVPNKRWQFRVRRSGCVNYLIADGD